MKHLPILIFGCLLILCQSAMAATVSEGVETQIVYDFIRIKNPHQIREFTYSVALNTVKSSRGTGSPLSIIVGIQKPESNFNVLAVSRADARGPMQVHFPTWGPRLGIPASKQWLLQVPAINIEAGARIFKYYYALENGDIIKALFDYLGLPDSVIAKLPQNERLVKKNQRLRYASAVIKTALEFQQFASGKLAGAGPR